jgi:hypothetical protein
LNSWHKQSSQMYTCNPSAGGCAWAACGKSLVSKQTALGTRDSSVKKYAGSAMTRFPTGCAGPWKTLVLIRCRHSHGMREQKRVPLITTASFPPPLYRGQGTRRLLLVPLFNVKVQNRRCISTIVRFRADERTSQKRQVFNWMALAPPRMPRGDFSAWAFLIVVNVHF